MAEEALTKKKLSNRRFRKTEEEILRFFVEEGGNISVDEMAKKLGVARSTIYYHHKKLNDIVPDYEEYILEKYKVMISNLNNVDLNFLYFKILIFILQEKDIFKFLNDGNRREILIKFLSMIERNVMEDVKLPLKHRRILMIYNSEVSCLIENWEKEGFNEDKIDEVVLDIMYLTKTMIVRLGPLAK